MDMKRADWKVQTELLLIMWQILCVKGIPADIKNKVTISRIKTAGFMICGRVNETV